MKPSASQPKPSSSSGAGGNVEEFDTDDGSNDGNVDFETQLRLECEEAERVKRVNEADAENARDSTSGARTRVDEDGTLFEWDEARQAWFPRIDSETQLKYQLGYGVATDDGGGCQGEQPPQPSGEEFQALSPGSQATAREYWDGYYNSQEYRDWYEQYSAVASFGSSAGQATDQPQQKPQQNRKRGGGNKPTSAEQQQQWFQVTAEQNTHVFVQNLPTDMTEPEFVQFMSKCGMVLHDPLTRKPKVKLYTDPEGQFTGEARCGYIKRESVALALQILDGYRLKPDAEVRVTLAEFKPNPNYDPAKRRKLTNKEKKKVKEHQQRLLSWVPGDSAAVSVERRSDRILVVSNAFEPREFDSDPLLVERIRGDLTERCGQFGRVKKAVVHDRNPMGVVLVTFAEATECGMALGQLQGRVFRGRVLAAEPWDGRTKYHVEETPEEAARRREIWERQILGDSEGPDQPTRSPDQPAGSVDQPAGSVDQPIGSPDQPTGSPDQPIGSPDQPTGSPDQPTGSPDQPTGSPDQPTGSPDQPIGSPDQPAGSVDQPIGSPDQPIGSPDQPIGSPDQPIGSPDQPTGSPDDDASTDVDAVASASDDSDVD